MPIKGMTDLETLNDRYPKPVISVFKGTPKVANKDGKLITGSNLGTKFRLHIDTKWLRQDAGLSFNNTGDMECEELRVFLAYSSPDRAFPTFNEKWATTGLEIVCNGESIIQETQVVTDKIGNKFPKFFKVEKPCAKQGAPECKLGCRPSGRLYFYLQQLGTPNTLAVLRTVHKGEITQLAQLLHEYYAQFGSLSVSPFPSPNTFGRIPFILKRLESKNKKPILEKENNTYLRTGKYRDSADWPVTVTVDPDWYNKFQIWSQYLEAQKYGFQLQPEILHQLGFGGAPLMKSAEVNLPQLAPSGLAEDETAKRNLLGQLDRKLKEGNKSSVWAKEVAYQRYRVTGAKQLSIAQIENFIQFLSIPEEVEKYVETYADNYPEQFEGSIRDVEVIPVEELDDF